MPVRTPASHPAPSIVLADPNTSTRQSYGDYLKSVGCQVVFATNSDAALAQSLSVDPDVIIASHQLRPLDGPRLCQHLKDDPRTSAIPVIMLTANKPKADRRLGREVACAVLVVQPISPEDLFRTVSATMIRAQALHRRAQRTAARARTLVARATQDRRPRGFADVAPVARAFDADRFLDTLGHAARVSEYLPGAVIYAQGGACDAVLYVRKGVVKLSVLSKAGHEAVIGLISAGDFFGEGCLTGQPIRLTSATAVAASTILRLEKGEMRRLLREHHAVSDRFIARMLARNTRIEADLVDQLFNSSEKRLARTLLLLARYEEQDSAITATPHMSQSTLAEMVGTTRSRINFFMRKFARLGFIEYKNGLKVNKGLLTVVLSD
jgi:CRP/FNR family cyclic AMP-dependent transcriptional regulator